MFLSLLLLRKIQTSGASDVPWEEWGVLGPRELIGSSQVGHHRLPPLTFLAHQFMASQFSVNFKSFC